MATQERLIRQQILREAEGYLDLVTVLSDQWALRPDVRDRLAQRALNALDTLDGYAACRREVAFLRGQALRVMERHAEALVPLRQAAEADPENIHIYLALAWCYKRTGRLDLAIESLEEALAHDRSEAVLHYNLACYWSLAGNARTALGYLARAFDIDTNYRDLAATEKDFDPIRDDPQFQALTSVIV